MFKSAKTFILLAALSGLLLFIGSFFEGGLTVALIIAVLMNGISYFFSHKIAIKMARAEPMEEAQYPEVYRVVRELSQKAGKPMPDLYLSPSPQLNAFATGRNPENAVVCVNRGLYEALSLEELEGVLGHELQHVYNRDILVGSVAATIAAAITYLAFMARWAAIFGGGGDRERGGGNIFVLLATAILAPIAATVIQLAVTRSRESLADKSGAELTGKPLALARALAKLEAGNNDPRRWRQGATPAETSNAFQHLYIAAPFGGKLGTMSKLFRSHPPTDERIAQLEQIARDMGQLGPGESIQHRL